MGLLVKFRERELLLKSKVIEDYPNLLNYLETTPNLKESDYNMLSENMRLFFRSIYPNVLSQAIKEWVPDPEHPVDELDEAEKIHCQICNHKIKYICHILNLLNKNRLVIGTECVKHFGIDKEANLKKLFEQMRKLKKLERLNELVPEISEELDHWNQELSKYPLLIPSTLENPYILLGKEIKILYEDFLNNKYSKEEELRISKQMSDILDKQNNMLQQMKAYCKFNENNILIPTRSMVNSLIRSNTNQVIDWLKEDGRITERTLYKIENEELIGRFLPIVTNTLDRNNIKNFRLGVTNNGSRLMYNYNLVTNDSIILSCPHKDFVLEFGEIFFSNGFLKVSISKLVSISTVCSEDSVAKLTWIINKDLKEKGYLAEIHSYDIEFEEVIIRDIRLNQFIIRKLWPIINKGLEYVFGLNLDLDNLNGFLIDEGFKRYERKFINELIEDRNRNVL